ncbi:MAG: LysR family transcriptional regulator [Pseudomonadota bacterium]|nr:LysR family transcriptional regulator [Pseudomonadota bacterium]
MNITSLRTLVSIADFSSFAVAARRLHLTPAAVSQQMRAMESELQTALFDRTTRPPRLTAHGQHVAQQARELLQGFDAFVDGAKASGEIAGRLTLGCIAGISSDLIPRALANLRERYPRLQIRMEEGQSGPLIEQVRRRELDAAVVTQPLLPEPELEALFINREALVVVVHPDSSVRGWREALSSLPLLRLNRTSGMGTLIDHEIRRAGLVVDDAMELDSSEAVLSMAEAGLGVGVIQAGRLKLARPRAIRTFAFGDPPVYRNVVLMERLNNQRSDLSQVLYLELKRLTGSGKEPPEKKSGRDARADK